ncbi:MAG: cytochrome c oxidase subunit II [Actinomycetota bacterium]
MRVPLPKSVARWTALAALALTAAACADDKPLNTFEPAGPAADRIDGFMFYIWPIMGIIFVLVIGGGIWISVKNRVKPEDYDPEDLPPQTHGNTRLEVAWTILPAVLLAGISVPMVAQIWDLEERNDACEPGEVGEGCDGLDIMVIGQQWWWEYRYDADGDGFFQDANGDGVVDGRDQELPLEIALDPDDVVTATELVIPADQQIDLLLTSRDVIHSYWIPRLNGKRDTVPGRLHTWSVEAFEPGKYTGWCTEYCGLSHARMRMSTIALPQDEFDAWLDNQKQLAEVPEVGTDAYEGRELFAQQCASCHVINDNSADFDPGDDVAFTIFDYGENFEAALTSKAAPNLTHFATRSSFAGGIFGVYLGPGTDPNDDALDVSQYLTLAEQASAADSRDDFRVNSAQLKRWIANAPSQKAMDPDDGRGMTAFPQLTDEQLDNLVAYLATLD